MTNICYFLEYFTELLKLKNIDVYSTKILLFINNLLDEKLLTIESNQKYQKLLTQFIVNLDITNINNYESILKNIKFSIFIDIFNNEIVNNR